LGELGPTSPPSWHLSSRDVVAVAVVFIHFLKYYIGIDLLLLYCMLLFRNSVHSRQQQIKGEVDIAVLLSDII